MMPTASIRVVARVVALPNQVEEVKSVLMGIIEPTRKEKGCIVYELLQNQEDPTDFTFVEEWESQELLDTHLAAAHIAEASLQLKGLVVTAPDIRIYRLLA